MGFKCGIVGLPNVGKSTLFNALTESINAEAANYPFCTIEPNVGKVPVPDSRLQKIAELAGSKEILPTAIEFVDIAGLVKGASKGEGLGNKFLANIRETDTIIHVLRCFEDDNITHTEGSVDPLRDAEIIETELMISDLESLEKRLPGVEKKAKSGDKESKEILNIILKALEVLKEGKPARKADLTSDELKSLQIITSKPVVYVCNVGEEDVESGNEFSKKIAEKAEKENSGHVVICSKIEEELIDLSSVEEKKEFLESLGIEEPGLNKVIRAGYETLGLLTFFTAGPKETRAWTVKSPAFAPQAAGVIHTDFEKGFICADTIAYEDFISCGGEQKAKESGKMRQEGKEYVVQDGDIIHFKFNV